MARDLHHVDGFLVKMAVAKKEGVYGLLIPPDCRKVGILHYFYSCLIPCSWLTDLLCLLQAMNADLEEMIKLVGSLKIFATL